jgi:hypothetical protein
MSHHKDTRKIPQESPPLQQEAPHDIPRGMQTLVCATRDFEDQLRNVHADPPISLAKIEVVVIEWWKTRALNEGRLALLLRVHTTC